MTIRSRTVTVQMIFSLVLLWLAPADGRADLTIMGENTPGENGGTDRYMIYLKDEQMRIDQLEGVEGDQVSNSMIIRFTGTPPGTLFLDHEARTVDIIPIDTVLSAEQMVSAEPDAASVADPVVERDETREVMGRTTEGYDFRFSGTATPPGMDSQQMPPGMADMVRIRLDMTGTAWVAPDLDGADELAAFYRKMAENQMTFGGVDAEPPAPESGEALTYPGLSYGLTNVMAEIAEKGFPLRTEMTADVSVDAQGPMAGMLRQMMSGATGSSSHVSEVKSVLTDSVDAGLFFDGGLPEGYEENVISPP